MTVIIVDTNVIFNNQLNRLLSQKVRDGVLTVYVPTLVHAERVRQVAHEKGILFSIDFFRQTVALTGFTLLELTQTDAEAVAEVWLYLKDRLAFSSENEARKYWRKHRFDIVICAVAHSRGHIFVTDERKDRPHFAILTNRLRIDELQPWLDQL